MFSNYIKYIYNKIERNKYKIFILSLSFFLILLLRCFLELFFSRFYYDGFITKEFQTFLLIFSQWILWYFSVFLIVFSVCRYFLKIDKNKVLYFVFGGFILVIPVVASIVQNEVLNMNYLSLKDLGAFWRSFFSLMYLDGVNNFMFYEFLVLFFFMPIVNYVASRNIIKSIISPFIIYFFIIFILATRYVCSSPECLITIQSNLKDAIGVFYVIPFFSLLMIVFLWPEFKMYLNNKKNILNSSIFLVSIIGYFFLLLFLIFVKSILFYDLIFLTLFYFIFYYLTAFIITHYKDKAYNVIQFLIFPEFIFFITFFIYVLFI